MLRLADSILQKGVPGQPRRERKAGLGGALALHQGRQVHGGSKPYHRLPQGWGCFSSVQPVAPCADAAAGRAGGAPGKRDGDGKIGVGTAEG